MTFGSPSTTQLNASWDVVDLVAMVVEVFIQETGNEKDRDIKISIPSDSLDADDQFQWFKNKWEAIRPAVPIEKTA
eukprot:12922254-Prorocentrum_lima.AAC.1